MSLAELLPAVRALTRDEQAELVRVVTDDLAKEDPLWWHEPGQEYDTGPGLHDAHEAAANLWAELQQRKGQE